MFRIDTATAVPALPAPAAAGAPGYFTGGDPTTGTPPTTVSPDWFNQVQEELLSILAAASIAESKAVNNQVLAALQAMFAPLSGFSNSLGTNWWQQLPGGLIVQCATTSFSLSAVHGTVPISWPVAFPNTCLNAFSTSIGTNSYGGSIGSSLDVPPSSTGATLMIDGYGSTPVGAGSVQVLAFGK
ncbi:MAG: hypothetical protein P4L68_08280 [Methylovirgula sp.]|nr:hypothetical protein [Methylovirgula sp.]